jgi:threonylcarbamoyladenosine tRNA methylthiotransferase MtaB
MSKPIEIVIDEACWARHCGYHEVVLVGANIGLYGSDIGMRLHDLLKALSGVRDLPRIRLSSIEPKFIDAAFVDCLRNVPFCRHFHIPLQSADNTVLDRMDRGYTAEHLQNCIDIIQASFTDCALGADIIVGFPGEGEKEFQSTYSFIEKNPFTHLHVFPYSVRPGTVASAFGDDVSRQEKRRRLWLLKELIEQKNYAFRKRLCGKTLRIIAERQKGRVSGVTDNYIRVDIDSNCAERALCTVMINRVTRDKTYGTHVSA